VLPICRDGGEPHKSFFFLPRCLSIVLMLFLFVQMMLARIHDAEVSIWYEHMIL